MKTFCVAVVLVAATYAAGASIGAVVHGAVDRVVHNALTFGR